MLKMTEKELQEEIEWLEDFSKDHDEIGVSCEGYLATLLELKQLRVEKKTFKPS